MSRLDTKERFIRALHGVLTTVPLLKMTIPGITRTAGVARQAFYYHFSDIRNLTAWVFEREVADQIITQAIYEDQSDKLFAMLVWMRNHPEETRSVVSPLGVEDLQIFLHRQLRVIMEPIADQHCIDLWVTEDDRVLVTDYFALAILGHVSQWLTTGMSINPYILTERIAHVLDGQVCQPLEAPAVAPIPGAQRT